MSDTVPLPSESEIEQVIAELEQYRERLVKDVLGLAQKVKLPQKTAMNHLANHPEIARIDESLKQLRTQQASF